MRFSARLIAITAFASAAVLATAVSVFAVKAIETRSANTIDRLLDEAGLGWAEVEADGMLVTLTGTAPTEATRFRALTVAGTVVDAARVIDAMEVTPGTAITAPRFSLELLRNDDGISLIGLVPARYEHAELVEQVVRLTGDDGVADMLETADFPVPEGWDAAVAFGFEALHTLPRSKISIAADRVEVVALSDSAEQRQRLEANLLRRAPEGLSVTIDISAPRPVITPFTLRFVIDEGGPRFDACSADSERTRARILTAAVTGGLPHGEGRCTIGLGVPTPRWAEASVVGINALVELGQGSVTFSDVDVSLIAGEDVTQAEFDRVLGELTASLPDVFSLKATLTEPETQARDQGPPQFTAALDPEGQVQLRGRLTDEMQRDAVDAYARARFGADFVYTATRFDEALPEGWAVRVLAGVSALAELNSGSLLVEAERVVVRGVTNSQDARDSISRILSDRLGQGADFRVDVTYEAPPDPVAELPTPGECVARANAVLAEGPITFAPASAEIDISARRTLNQLADVMRECMDVRLEIGGHTDSQGRAETNLRLSQRRADSVLQALMGLRVPVGNFSARGYGATQPVADNATEEGREANRRIEFRVIPPGGEREADEAVALDETGAPVVADETAEAAAEALPAIRPEPRPADLAPDETPDETPDEAPDEADAAGTVEAEAGAADPASEPEVGADALPAPRPEPRPGDPADDETAEAAAAPDDAEAEAGDEASGPADAGTADTAADASGQAETPGDGAAEAEEGAAEAEAEPGPTPQAAAETGTPAPPDPAAGAGLATDAEIPGPDAGSGDDTDGAEPYDSAAPQEQTIRPQRRPGDDQG